jgi:glutamate carboxypeptidase
VNRKPKPRRSKPKAGDILKYLQGKRQVMIELLKHTAEAESPSDEPDSQHAIREIIIKQLQMLGYRTRRIPGQARGGMLYAVPCNRRRGDPAQLMLGHYDTVWPLGTLRDMPFVADGDVVHGPGVFDMKGGIVQALLALETLQHFNTSPAVTPVMFLNSDEEIGSRESRRYIERLAPLMDRVLVLEPSLGPSGLLKTARKGIGRFTVTVQGEAAHAGLDPGAGASAILELSHVIQSLFALNDLERGRRLWMCGLQHRKRPGKLRPPLPGWSPQRRAQRCKLKVASGGRRWNEPRPIAACGAWPFNWARILDWSSSKVWQVAAQTETRPVFTQPRSMAWVRSGMAHMRIMNTCSLKKLWKEPHC